MNTNIRDRVKEYRKIPSSQLLDNSGDWRRHPQAQQSALLGILGEVGIAGALTAYYSPRNGGQLTLIDGHLRRSALDVEWPVLILDLTDDEADKLLVSFDPLSAMAEADSEKLKALLTNVQTESDGFAELLNGLLSTLTESDTPTMVDSPEEFKEYGEDIATDYCCPKCGYAWSGQTH